MGFRDYQVMTQQNAVTLMKLFAGNPRHYSTLLKPISPHILFLRPDLWAQVVYATTYPGKADYRLAACSQNSFLWMLSLDLKDGSLFKRDLTYFPMLMNTHYKNAKASHKIW